MILPCGNVQALLDEMKRCLHMMELSDGIKSNDQRRVAALAAALRKRIDEIEHSESQAA